MEIANNGDNKMNELIEVANNLYAAKNWEEARKVYINIIDNYLYEVPVGVIAKLAIAQRMLEHLESSEKTLILGFEKFPSSVWLLIEYAALENKRKNWESAINYWEKAKLKSKEFKILNYQRYAKALQQICLSSNKNIDGIKKEEACTKLQSLIKEASALYGEDKALKKILDTVKTTETKKK